MQKIIWPDRLASAVPKYIQDKIYIRINDENIQAGNNRKIPDTKGKNQLLRHFYSGVKRY
jgi:hypothetical protein